MAAEDGRLWRPPAGRQTLDLYAQVVTAQQQAAADAVAARFLGPTARDKRGIAAQTEGRSAEVENDREGL